MEIKQIHFITFMIFIVRSISFPKSRMQDSLANAGRGALHSESGPNFYLYRYFVNRCAITPSLVRSTVPSFSSVSRDSLKLNGNYFIFIRINSCCFKIKVVFSHPFHLITFLSNSIFKAIRNKKIHFFLEKLLKILKMELMRDFTFLLIT